MKLLFCSECGDMKGLHSKEWRMCYCGASGGQYNRDGMTATLGGSARVFGVGNPFFNPLYVFLESEGKKKLQKKYYGHEDGDCWWGEYEGDVQIFRIASAYGPRLKVTVREFSKTAMIVTIVDKREHTVDGLRNRVEVTVPVHPEGLRLMKRRKHGKEDSGHSDSGGSDRVRPGSVPSDDESKK